MFNIPDDDNKKIKQTETNGGILVYFDYENMTVTEMKEHLAVVKKDLQKYVTTPLIEKV